MVQTVCDKPLEQGRQDINVESTFYNAFMLSDWSSDYSLVRVVAHMLIFLCFVVDCSIGYFLGHVLQDCGDT